MSFAMPGKILRRDVWQPMKIDIRYTAHEALKGLKQRARELRKRDVSGILRGVYTNVSEISLLDKIRNQSDIRTCQRIRHRRVTAAASPLSISLFYIYFTPFSHSIYSIFVIIFICSPLKIF